MAMRLDTATKRMIAVETGTDPRSVARELSSPGSVRGMSGQRIRAALAARGVFAVAPVQATPRAMMGTPKQAAQIVAAGEKVMESFKPGPIRPELKDDDDLEKTLAAQGWSLRVRTSDDEELGVFFSYEARHPQRNRKCALHRLVIIPSTTYEEIGLALRSLRADFLDLVMRDEGSKAT